MIEKSAVSGLRSEVYLKVVGVFIHSCIHHSKPELPICGSPWKPCDHLKIIHPTTPLDKFFCQLCLPLTLSLFYLYLDIDECINNPCHSGTCKNSPRSYKCTCPPEWEGEDCQSKPHNKFCMETNAQPNALYFVFASSGRLQCFWKRCMYDWICPVYWQAFRWLH